MEQIAVFVPSGATGAADAELLRAWRDDVKPTAERPWTSASGTRGTFGGTAGHLIGIWREHLLGTDDDVRALAEALRGLGCIVAENAVPEGFEPAATEGE